MRICENLITDYKTANFTEDETEWSGLPTTYMNGDEARDGHYIYKYAGTNETNSDLSPSESPTKWLKTRATNYYAMLGDRTQEQTITNGELVIEVTSNNYDTLALLNVKGSQIDIEIKDSNGVIQFTDSYNLNNNIDVIDAYSYYFSPFEYFTAYYTNIPIYYDATIKITISTSNGTAAIGRLICGQSYKIGDSLYGSSFSLESYSKTTFDEFGTATLTPREAVYNSSYIVSIPTSTIPRIQRKRKSLDAIPVLFIGDDTANSILENLLSYGLWQGADIVMNNPTRSELNHTIKELL